jgi:hypothetical protein
MKTGSGRLAVAIALAVSAAAGGGAQGPAQEPPATARLTAYVRAFNSGDPAEMRRFIEENFGDAALREAGTDARAAHYESARARFTSMTLRRIVAERENRAFALVTAGNQQALFLQARVEPAPPHKLLAILLTMTSGIGDFFGPRYDATPKERIRSIKDYLPLFADQPLEFVPGTGNRYSNGGYVVLGAIIEKVSGQDYYAYVRENVFRPAGMLATDSYPRDAGTPNLALGYANPGRRGQGRVLNFDTLPGRGSSAGGGYSTAEDMLRYVRALASGTQVAQRIRGWLPE